MASSPFPYPQIPFGFSPAATCSFPIPSHHHPLPHPSPSYHYAAAYPPPPPGFFPAPTDGASTFPTLSFSPDPAYACTTSLVGAPASGLFTAQAVFPSSHPTSLPFSTTPTQNDPNRPPAAPAPVHGDPYLTPHISPLLHQPIHLAYPQNHQPPAAMPATSAPLPSGRSSPTPRLLDAILTTPNRERRPPQSHTSSTSARKSDNILYPAIPDFMGHGGDLSKGNGASGEPISDEQPADETSVRNHTGPGSLSMPNAGSDHRFVTLQATTAPTPVFSFGSDTGATASSSASSLNSYFGESCAAPTPVCDSVSVTRPSAVSSTMAYVAPQVFGEMPQPYGFSNLDRRSVFRADVEGSGNSQSSTPPVNEQNSEKQTHHSQDNQSILDMWAQAKTQLETISEKLRYAIMQNSRETTLDCIRKNAASKPLLAQEDINLNCPPHQAVLEPECAVGDAETEDSSHAFVQVFTDTPEQRRYEVEQQGSRQSPKCFSMPIFSPETPTVGIDIDQLLNCPCEASECRTWDDEYQGDDNSLWEKSVCRTATRHYISLFPWDPGASASLYSSNAKPLEGLSSVAIGFPEVLNLCNRVGPHVQQLRDPYWNVLVARERREEWDPGGHTILSSTLNRDILGVPSCVSPQNFCKVPLRQESCGIQFEWDPGTLSLIDMLLAKTAVADRVHSSQTPFNLLTFIEQPVDLKQLLSQLLPQSHSWYNTPNVCLQSVQSWKKRCSIVACQLFYTGHIQKQLNSSSTTLVCSVPQKVLLLSAPWTFFMSSGSLYISKVSVGITVQSNCCYLHRTIFRFGKWILSSLHFYLPDMVNEF